MALASRLLLSAAFAAAAAGPPLNIERLGNHACISWPTQASEFVLKQTERLQAPDWTIVAEPVLTNGPFQMTTVVIGEGSCFYRLEKRLYQYRLPLHINAAGSPRVDKPVEVELRLTALLNERQLTAEVDPKSFQVAETDAQGQLVNDQVAFQFDPSAEYHPATNASGNLVFLLSGTTAASATRHFCLSFGATTSTTPVEVTNLVSVGTETVVYQGQASFQISTLNASYYYHIPGAGLAAMVDQAGNDWISYRPLGGSAGSYRGIPNLVYPEGHFHPGSTTCTSTVVSVGPIKIKVLSESRDKKWACTWEFFPSCARLTVLKTNAPYWFLYEGTPGGKLDPSSDFVIRSPGVRTAASVSWDEDLPAPEWVCFGDAASAQMLYLSHHEDDNARDSYWPMENNMTVFGFGRSGLSKYLDQVPGRFTIGFAPTNELANIGQIINGICRDLIINIGPLEAIPVP